MTRERLYILYLLGRQLSSNRIVDTDFGNMNMNTLLELTFDQDVFSILYPINHANKYPHALRKIYLTQINKMIALDAYASEILLAFSERNVRYLPLKGIVYKKYYPVSESRQMADIDVLVEIKDFKRASDILEELGYIEEISHEESDHHAVYAHPQKGTVELHHTLLDKRCFQADIAHFEKRIWNRTIISDVCGVKSECIGHLDTLIYMLLHTVSHFLVSGIGLKQLIDFALYSSYHKNDINWVEFWRETENLGIRKLALSVAYIGNLYFGGEIDIDTDEVDLLAVETFVDDVWRSGDNGRCSINNATGSILLKNADQSTEHSWLSNVAILIKHFDLEVNGLNPNISRYKMIKPVLVALFLIRRIFSRGGGGLGSVKYAIRSVKESKRRFKLAKIMKLR